jgi:ABC-type uncharacterized transport system substrate-binding protein
MKRIFLFLLAINFLYAHPHVFIEVHPTIKVKNHKINLIHFKWVIDEMTSSMLIMELDTNGNGKIDKKENSIVFNDYFSSLKKDDFYTIMMIKKRPHKFKPINFKATIENYKVCYSFDIKENVNIKDLKFYFRDETFFVAMILKNSFINIKGAKAVIKPRESGGYQLEFK